MIDKENRIITISIILSLIIICISIPIGIIQRRGDSSLELFCGSQAFLGILAFINIIITYNEKEEGQYSNNAEFALIISFLAIAAVIGSILLGTYVD